MPAKDELASSRMSSLLLLPPRREKMDDEIGFAAPDNFIFGSFSKRSNTPFFSPFPSTATKAVKRARLVKVS